MTTMTNQSLTFGTRGSALARRQTEMVAQALQAAHPNLTTHTQIFTTKGDRELSKPLPQIGGKGLFTAELEAALREGRIDLAVHSLKDLPIEDAPGLTIGAILAREDPADVLVSRAEYTVETLPANATVGTSSLRRAAQLLAVRSDLRIQPIRGNIDTRIAKALADDGPYDAILLAAAGLNRMHLTAHISQRLPFGVMLPAPAQGAVAVQCRADDVTTCDILVQIDHTATRQAVSAERAFLATLGGGCSLPVAALGTIDGAQLCLEGSVASLDGQAVVRVQKTGLAAKPEAVGQALAQAVLVEGAQVILESLHAEALAG